ncbi:hypothetical protein Tco_0007097 [Tanacetum coccineum]
MYQVVVEKIKEISLKEAIAIWRILVRNYSSGYWKDLPQAVTKQDLGVNIISAKETAAAEATRILKLSDQHLILQHLGWVWLLFEYVYVEVGTWIGLAAWVTFQNE